MIALQAVFSQKLWLLHCKTGTISCNKIRILQLDLSPHMYHIHPLI